jgi:hypothetical protein
MGKIIVILLICAAGAYAYKKGYVTQWVEKAQESVAVQVAPKAPPTNPQWDERMRQQREHADRVLSEHQARIAAGPQPTSADQCARARKNVQEMQSWMRSGGSVVEVKSHKKLNENQTFDALARNRQFVEDNCR